MIKTLVALIMVCAVLSFYGCKTEKKPEELPKTGVEQKSARKPEQSTRSREGREGREGRQGSRNFQAVDLKLYNESNLITSIAPEQFDSLATQKIKGGRQQTEMAAMLLSDLLNKNNLSGKGVMLSGESQSISLSWDDAMDPQIYICKSQEGQFRLFDQGRKVRLQGPLTKIEVTAQALETTKPEQKNRQGRSERG